MRSSMGQVDSNVPVRVARGAVGCARRAGREALLWPEPFEWDAAWVTSPPALAGRRKFVRRGTRVTTILLGTAGQRRANIVRLRVFRRRGGVVSESRNSAEDFRRFEGQRLGEL